MLLSVFLQNDLDDHVFDGVGQANFKSRANASCWPYLLFLSFLLLLFSVFLPSRVGCVGLWSLD